MGTTIGRNEVKIKICDICDKRTAAFCADMGVSFLGLQQIEAPLDEWKVALFNEIREVSGASKLVLVTRERNLDELLKMCTLFPFDYIQTRFPPSIDSIRQFKLQLRRQGCLSGIIAAFSPDQLDHIDVYEFSHEADYLLFDSPNRGGTGECLPEDMLDKIKQKAQGIPYFFAGGLNSENVASKIRQLDPFAVDVQTGVEVKGQKHIKDFEKIRQFVHAVRSAYL